jgi:multidrug resistance efflux pump
MSTHFSRSMRALENDGARRSLLFLTVIGSILGLWVVWFAASRVVVYATTTSARLEVDRENHPVDAPVAGRVIAAPPEMGKRVNAGDLLVQLDANVERLARNETLARVAPANAQLETLKAQVEAGQRALDQERRSGQAALSEAQAKLGQSVSDAKFAADEARRIASLQAKGLISELEVLRARNVADARQSDVRAAEFTAGRISRDNDTKEQDRLAQLARLKGEIAALEGSVGGSLVESERLGYEMQQREVRAPISGTLAEVSSLRAGSMVAAGDRICTIVPDGELRVVALFAPSSALGRVRAGQSARVRLDGFPWTQYGSAVAHVSNVAGELRDGQVRVELSLDARQDSMVPFQHGLPAQVDIEVEHLSPFAMVLRTIGRNVLVSAAAAQ